MMISYPDDGNARCRQIEDDSFWFQHRNRCVLALVDRFRPDGPIYDVGGGNGFVARALQDAGYESVVVEPGGAGADNARRLGVRQVICATLDQAGLADHSLPAIGIFDVLEHMEDERGFLDQLHRALRPDGWLYVTVPAYAGLWSTADDRAGHWRRYTRGSLLRALRTSGFGAVYCGYVFWCLPLPIWLGRALPNRLGLWRERDAERVRREHTGGGGRAAQLAKAAFGWERWAIERGLAIPFGGSVLCAARPA